MRLLSRFILGVVLLLGPCAQAQNYYTVDAWRLEKACKELVLLDSLTKDYAAKDSLIGDLKELNTTRQSENDALRGRLTEKILQLDLSQETTNNVMKEMMIWKSRYRRQRRVLIGLAVAVPIVGFIALK
jgi:hypothetical protein